MILSETGFDDLFVIENTPYKDDRGLFSRVYCKKEFSKICNKEFVQINRSLNLKKGTVRGMHYQKSPFAECKLIMCVRGGIFDVVVDIRKNSPTFLKWYGVILSEENWKMIFIPEGFAHGFQTLDDNSDLIYHHTEFYSPEYEGGINPLDATLRIEWPLQISNCSKKDLNLPYIDKEFPGL